MILPDYGVNPISGKRLEEEIEIARAIGGRLPYRAYVNLIKRGVVPRPKTKRRRARPAKANCGDRNVKTT